MGKLSKELRMDIHNRFDIEVVDVETGKVKQRARAFNVVCDNFVNAMCSSQASYGFARYLQYGSGAGTPSRSDVSLFNRNGYKEMPTYNYSDTHYDAINNVLSGTRKVVLGISEAVGVTLTEVGLAYGTGNGTLSTHAMLQDMNGNVITITKTDTDVINLYATVYVHFAQEAKDGFGYARMTFYKNSEGITNSDLALLGYYPGTYMATDFVASKGGIRPVGYSDPASASYGVTATPAEGKIVIRSARWDVSQANINGVRALGMGNFLLQKGTNGFAAFSITGETVGTGDGSTTKFKTKFDMPYNASVKVNGVTQQSGVTVKKLPVTKPSETRMGYTNHAISLDELSTPNHHVYTARARYYDNYSNDLLRTAPGVTTIFFNPMWEEGEGFSGFNGHSGYYDVWASNDCENWTYLTGSSSAWDAQYKAYKYFKFTGKQTGGTLYYFYETHDTYNIIFDNPPAQGDVITVDYTTDYIPKDSDHVLDVELTFTFGEWTGE